MFSLDLAWSRIATACFGRANACLCLLSGVTALAVQAFCSSGDAAAHPLDPLSSDEIAIAVAVLRGAGDTDSGTRFALIDLNEPDKSEMLAWRPGQPVTRKAFVIARQRRTVYEAVIDLTERTIVRWGSIPNVQSGILPGELREAEQITTADPGWQAAMRRRGFDLARVSLFCVPLSAGFLANPTEKGRRLLKVTCFDKGGTSNVWARPIEGLYAVVDLDRKVVIRLNDRPAAPVSRAPADYAQKVQPALRPPPTPMPSERTDGPNFTVSGNEVRWNKWAFHYRLDPRTGLILSLVRYRDYDRERMVLYRGSLSEMFVPYMDPDRAWSFRTFMDVGEYGIGPLSLPLTPPSDCRAGATFLNAVLPDEHGAPITRDGVVCLFERNTAAPLWRHAETARDSNSYEGRPAVELVMRTIPSLGNYDYVIDWVLTEAGVIRVDVGATGIDAVKGVQARSMDDPSVKRDTAYGTLVAPNLVGVNHDHFLSFRLDVDIDGSANTLIRQQLAPQRVSGAGGRRSMWRVVERPVRTEGALQFGMHGDAELWRIENPQLTNSLGQHPGYELRGGHLVTSLLAPDDWPQRRAAFSAAPLWITAYDPRELYAAGLYPNQSRGRDGLPAYVARHRPVACADIVLWYTMGFHHIPRPEDWPVLPTMWHSLSLVPYGFFERNPAIDVPVGFAMPKKGE